MQIVIKAKDVVKDFDYWVSAAHKAVRFGAVLSHEVLSETLHLQNTVANITAEVNGQTVTLQVLDLKYSHFTGFGMFTDISNTCCLLRGRVHYETLRVPVCNLGCKVNKT